MIPGAKEIDGKASVASPNGAGGSGWSWGQSPLPKTFWPSETPRFA